jgi:hypothetical protein
MYSFLFWFNDAALASNETILNYCRDVLSFLHFIFIEVLYFELTLIALLLSRHLLLRLSRWHTHIDVLCQGGGRSFLVLGAS